MTPAFEPEPSKHSEVTENYIRYPALHYWQHKKKLAGYSDVDDKGYRKADEEATNLPEHRPCDHDRNLLMTPEHHLEGETSIPLVK